MLEAKSIAPIRLTDAEQATHEIKQSFHDEAKTQKKAEWVVRKSDGKGYGRVVWYFPSGSVRQAGVAEDDKPVGTWCTFREDGSLSEEETAQPDGSFLLTYYDHGRRTRHGVKRKSPEGHFREDGWWWTQYQADHAPVETLYKMGSSVHGRPALDELRPLLAKGDVQTAAKRWSNPDDMYRGVDALVAEGMTLDAATVHALSRMSYDWTLHRVLPFAKPHAAALVPLLEAEAVTVMAENKSDGRDAQRVSMLLGQLGPKPMDPKWDRLLQAGLVAGTYQSAHAERDALFTEILLALPMERREQLIHGEHRPYKQFVWTYAHAAPTPRTLFTALTEIAGFAKARFRGNPTLETHVKSTLAAFGPDAAPKLIEWLEGPGKKVPQRALVVEALAGLALPDAAGVLLGLADDTLEDVQRAARDGLAKLGARAIPALEAAAKGKKAKLKALASELLAQLSGTAPAAPPVDLPESVQALEALRAGVSQAQRDEYLACLRGEPREVDANVRAALAKGPEALAFFTAHVIERLAEETSSSLLATLHSMLSDHAAWQFDKHPANAAAFAELIASYPGASAKHVLARRLEAKVMGCLPALGYQFERRMPEHAKEIAAHVASTHAWDARRLLLACARTGTKATRAEGVTGLVRCGAKIVPDVLPLLAQPNEAPLSAAEVLRALPDASALAPLAAAIAGEKNKKRKEALEAALSACKSVAGGPVDTGTLDADLAARAAKRKKKLPEIPGLPAIHFRDGAALSDGARAWLLGALIDEDGGEPNAELVALRKQLSDADCSAMLSAIDKVTPWANEHRWKAYAVGLLGDERQIGLVGEPLQRLASSGQHVLAGHVIEALRRNGTGRAIQWLDHWTEMGTGKLRENAAEALQRLCQERGLDRDGLVDLTTPHVATDEARAVIAKRFEAAMVCGRKFGGELLRVFVMEHPVARKVAEGLVFRGEGGALALLTDAGFVDASGKSVSPTEPLTIPHPCDVTDADLATFQELLAARGITPAVSQLARSFTRDASSGAALRQQKIETRRMLERFEKLGYRRGAPQDAGLVYEYYRPLAAGWILEAHFDGIVVSTGRPVKGTTSVLEGITPRLRDRYDGKPTAAMLSEALEDLRQVLAT